MPSAYRVVNSCLLFKIGQCENLEIGWKLSPVAFNENVCECMEVCGLGDVSWVSLFVSDVMSW